MGARGVRRSLSRKKGNADGSPVQLYHGSKSRVVNVLLVPHDPASDTATSTDPNASLIYLDLADPGGGADDVATTLQKFNWPKSGHFTLYVISWDGTAKTDLPPADASGVSIDVIPIDVV
jgi:hypothetical protein